MDPCYVQWLFQTLTCFQLFATFIFVNEIVAITQTICYVDIDIHDA